jgi:glycosyltransferase involved in cell wall biosynthesis
VRHNYYKNTDIVFLSHLPNFTNGAEKSLMEIIKDARSRRLNIHVILPSKEAFANELDKISVPYSVVDTDWWLASKTYDEVKNARGINSIVSLLRAIKPKLAVTNTIVNPSLAFAAAICDIPHTWIIREFGDTDYNFSYRWSTRDTIRIIDELSDKIFFNSDAVRRSYAKKLIHNRLGLLLQPYVEQPKPIKVDAQLESRMASASIRIVLVGKIHEAKGQIEAIQALKLLKERGHKPLLVLVGFEESQNYLNKIKRYVQKYRLSENVILTGFMDNPFGIVSRSDIVLICSRSEAFGRVTIEAMMLGKVVIGTNKGGTKEIITDGVTGLIYRVGDYTQLSDQIEKLIVDNNLSSKLAFNGKQYALSSFTKAVAHKDFFIYAERVIESKQPVERKSVNLSIFKDLINYEQVLKLEIKQAQQEISRYKLLAEKFRKDATSIEKELLSVYNSRSWRITKGVRLISAFVKKIQ